MEQLIDLILSNPFLIIIIVGALFSLLKGSKTAKEQQEKQQQQRQQQQGQRQPQQRTRSDQHSTRKPNPEQQASEKRTSPLRELKEAIEKEFANMREEKQVETVATEIPRMQQVDDMYERVNAAKEERERAYQRGMDAKRRREKEEKSLVSQYQQTKFKQSFTKSLGKQGLVNSVIMAEVLGSPRAKQPYQTPTKRRR